MGVLSRQQSRASGSFRGGFYSSKVYSFYKLRPSVIKAPWVLSYPLRLPFKVPCPIPQISPPLGTPGSLFNNLDSSSIMDLNRVITEIRAIFDLVLTDIVSLQTEIQAMRHDIDSIRSDIHVMRQDVNSLSTEMNMRHKNNTVNKRVHSSPINAQIKKTNWAIYSLGHDGKLLPLADVHTGEDIYGCPDSIRSLRDLNCFDARRILQALDVDLI
ncbi:hypothetical protein F5B18DRAFT_595936 [Nemania serpens]|nr:hypothetical protein F5B18DRAFT_595936 [Nemania serpens]